MTDLDIDWGAGTVLVEEDETVTEITLRETVYTGKSDDTPAVSEDEVLYHWLDGETLRVKFLRSKWGKQEVSAKILHVLLPTGKALGTVKIHSDTVSGNVKLQFSHDMAYVIDCTTTSGVYESQFGTDETKTGSRYTVGTNGDHIAVSTTSGKVSVTRLIKKPHQE